MGNTQHRAAVAAASPDERTLQVQRWRELREHAAALVASLTTVPPFPLSHLMAMAQGLAAQIGVQTEAETKLLAILIHNEAWRETVAGIPFSRRLLLLPQCLRSRATCPAARDAWGLLCDECGRCVLGPLHREATALGYAVLIAEGAEAASGMLKEGQVEAVIGVSCLPALEKTFARIADEALPAIAVPLLRDGCDATDVDLHLLLESIRLTGRPTKPAPLSLEACRASVQRWFEPEALSALLAMEPGHAAHCALSWLASGGKRWRPLLAASVYHALAESSRSDRTELVRTVAVAAECFHKASLAHDDIEDGDDLRYGGPTLHKEHGVPIALNAGDLLIGVGYRLLAHAPIDDASRVRMLTTAAEAHCELCVGQGEELVWRNGSDVPSVAALLNMFSRKTAPAFAVAIQLGAIAGGADTATCDALAAFSRALGIAYQIGDDLLDLRQDSSRIQTGGPQPSLLLSVLCEACSDSERQQLVAAIVREPYAASTLALQESLRVRYNVTAATQTLRETYRERALQALSAVRVSALKSVLTRLVRRILPRTDAPFDVPAPPPS